MSDVSQEMIDRVIRQAGRFVPDFTINDSSVYVFRVIDGCMRYARKPVITDACIAGMQVDSFILNVDVDAGKLEIEFMSTIHNDEYENTIIANVDYKAKPKPVINPDRLSIIQAYYWYFTHYHNGMWSLEYKRLSRMHQYYKPSMSESMPESPDAAAVYNYLENKAGFPSTGWSLISDDDGNDIVIWDER
jgi:hypothetical protein